MAGGSRGVILVGCDVAAAPRHALLVKLLLWIAICAFFRITFTFGKSDAEAGIQTSAFPSALYYRGYGVSSELLYRNWVGWDIVLGSFGRQVYSRKSSNGTLPSIPLCHLNY